MKEKKSTDLKKGYFDYHYIHVTISAIIQYTSACHIYICQLQTFQQNYYFSKSYCAPISLRSVFGTHALGGVRSELSL